MKGLISILVLSAILLSSAILSNSYAWKFAAVGDIQCKDAKKVADAIKKNSAPLRTVLLGDLGYSSTSKCVADAFGTDTSVAPTVGNHDKTSDIKKVFGKGDGVGTFKTQHVRFMSINTEMSISSVKGKVANLLNKYSNATDIDFIIPYSHKPYITNPSAHHKETEAKGYRAALLPLYDDSDKVRLVLFGHNHGYQHCSDNETVLDAVTAGTGGRKPYSWGSSMDDNCKNNISGVSGYLEVEVTNSTMTGQFVELNGNVHEDTIFQVSK
jgi:predicted phosphodiesterase